MATALKTRFSEEKLTAILDDIGINDNKIRTMTLAYMRKIAEGNSAIDPACLQCMASNFHEGLRFKT